MPKGSQEPFQSRPKSILNGLTEPFPRSGLPVPVCCLRSFSPKRPSTTPFQLDGIPHHQCPPTCVPATACTDYLAVASTMEARNNVPLGHNVPHLPWDMVEALPEVGVEFLTGDSARDSQQTLTIHLGLPHLTVTFLHHCCQLTSSW